MLLGQQKGAFSTAQSGILLPIDFVLVGGRRKATVTLSPPFTGPDYNVSLSAETVGPSFALSHEARTSISFIVNLGTASLAGLSSVTWRAEPV